MQNTEYNTYQQYKGFEQIQKIFSVLRTDERPKLNRVYMKEIQMRKGNKVMG